MAAALASAVGPAAPCLGITRRGVALRIRAPGMSAGRGFRAVRSVRAGKGSLSTGPARAPLFSPTPSTERQAPLDSKAPVAHPRRASALHAFRAGRGGTERVGALDRVIAALGYLLPFLDGAQYGRFLYMQYALVRVVMDPFVPLVQLLHSVSFLNFVIFFSLYLGVIQNQSLSRFVRFNVMQAVVLDILMILPSLLERIFSFGDGIGQQLTAVFYNTVFLYLFACFAFGVVSCLLGRLPRLPLVAEAADAQVPF